jgi:hypothetical protein
MEFKITQEEVDRCGKWIKEQDMKVANIQGRKEPSYGACGGGYTWSITPTYMGTIVKLSNQISGEEIIVRDLLENL